MPRTAGQRTEGLPSLRRSGRVTDLLVLYACTTLEPTQLRPIADQLGLTVQAASHAFRQLARDGLVEVRAGHYRPTVRGVAHLHASLDRLGADVAARLERLHVIRSTRAVAAHPLAAGEVVSLELQDGLLTARRGGHGPSHGRVRGPARAGGLVDVVELDGIVPIVPATVIVYAFGRAEAEGPEFPARWRRVLRDHREAVVAAEGLEAFHALRAIAARPVVRFAVAAACRAASQVGVPSVVGVEREALPRLLAEFSEVDPPPLEVRSLPGRAAPRHRAG